MEDLMKHLQGWLKRDRMEKQPGTIRENQKKEGHWCTAKRNDKSPQDQSKAAAPAYLYRKQGLWGDHCERILEERGALTIIAEGLDALTVQGEASHEHL